MWSFFKKLFNPSKVERIEQSDNLTELFGKISNLDSLNWTQVYSFDKGVNTIQTRTGNIEHLNICLQKAISAINNNTAFPAKLLLKPPIDCPISLFFTDRDGFYLDIDSQVTLFKTRSKEFITLYRELSNVIDKDPDQYHNTLQLQSLILELETLVAILPLLR